MSVFSPASSDTDVAPRLIWQMYESMMSPLVTGWLIRCRNFDRNWWFHFFSSHQLTLHLLVNRWEIRSFSRWLLHRCQQHRNNCLTLQNEETTTTCEFAVWRFDRFLLIHFGSVLISTVFLLVSPLSSTVTTRAFKLRTALVFTLVLFLCLCPCLSCPWRVCLSCLPLHTQRRFPLALLPLSLNGLAAMTVSPLSNCPLSAS